MAPLESGLTNLSENSSLRHEVACAFMLCRLAAGTPGFTGLSRAGARRRELERTKLNEPETNEAKRKWFMDELFYEVEIAIRRARAIQGRPSAGRTRRDAESIEKTLTGVAERLALQGHHAKEEFKRLAKTCKAPSMGFYSNLARSK